MRVIYYCYGTLGYQFSSSFSLVDLEHCEKFDQIDIRNSQKILAFGLVLV